MMCGSKYFDYHCCAACDGHWTHLSPKQTLGPHSRDAIITTEIKNFDSTTQIHIYPSPRDIFTTEVFLRILQEILQLDICGI